VLGQFAERKGEAVRAYRKYVEEGRDKGRQPELVGGGIIRDRGGWSRVISFRDKGERGGHDGRVLGNEAFVRRIMREADERLKRQRRNRQRKGSIEGVIRKRCKGAGVKEEELRGGGQRRKVSEVRAKIAYSLSREMGISIADIARNLGVGTPAIAMAIRKEEN
jgi:hypothetical protein